MHDFNSSIHASRRQRFLDQLGAAAAVIPAAPLATHHADCEWPFRQDSDFFYLTGFDEPDAVALLLPHRPEGERFVLFVQPKDPAAEVWTGFRWGTEGAVERYGADLAHPLDQLSEKLPEYLAGAEAIAFRVGRHASVESMVLSAWGRQLDTYARTGTAALGLVAPTPILHRLRLRKEPHELERLRQACRISAEAHERARANTHPGMNEAEVQAVIEAHFRSQGARGPAYGSIVAGGGNGAVAGFRRRGAAAAAAGSAGTSGGSSTGSGGGSAAPVISNYPAPSGLAGVAIQAALGQLGVPYRDAQASPGVAFDCSGLTYYAWAQAGVNLPRNSRMQAAAIPRVPIAAAQPGDLLFYYSPISHVGIYLGNGQLVHSPNTGTEVKVGNVNWSKVVAVGRPG